MEAAVQTVLGRRLVDGDRLCAALVGEHLIHTTVPTDDPQLAAHSRGHIARRSAGSPSNVSASSEDAAKELRALREYVDCLSAKSSRNEVLVVELTAHVHGRDVKSLALLSSGLGIHLVCSTSPDDDSPQPSATTVNTSAAAASQAAVNETAFRMISEIQIGIASAGLPSGTKVCAGVIGPLYLRFTPTASGLDPRDALRVKACATASAHFDGVPLLILWNHLHPVSLIQQVLDTIRRTGGDSAVGKTAVINPLRRAPPWAAPRERSDGPDEEVLQYDLSGVYVALRAGAYVGFTHSGCDSCFADMHTKSDAFWVGKSPIGSPSDLLYILHHLTTAEASEGDGTSGGSLSLEWVRSRVLLSTGAVLRTDWAASGGVGLAHIVQVERVFGKNWGSDDAPPHFWRNAADFLSFCWKPAAGEAVAEVVTFICHWCKAEVADKSQTYEKNTFVYCSMKCLNAHRNRKFKASATAQTC